MAATSRNSPRSARRKPVARTAGISSLRPFNKLVAPAQFLKPSTFIGVALSAIVLSAVVYFTWAATTANSTIVGIGGKCVDNAANLKQNSNLIQLYTCNSTPAQKWAVNNDGSIVNANGYCLDVAAASKAEYAYVQLYQCNNTVAQKWRVDSGKYLVNTNTGFCATAQYAGVENGTRLWMKACHQSAAQMWTVNTPLIPTPTPTRTPTPVPTKTPTPVPPTPTPTPPVSTGACPAAQPSGAGITAYQNLAGSTFLAKVNATSNTVSLPGGTFSFSNFATPPQDSSLLVGANITAPAGLVGSGIDKTVIQMAANTSNKASTTVLNGTNRMNLMYFRGKQGLKLSCFTLAGSNQGHLYNGLRFHEVKNATIENLKLVGAAPGNSNVPPGETFAINDYLGSNNTYKNIEIDGAGTGASAFGANGNMLVTSNNTWVDDYAHNNPYSAGIALWQLTGTQTLTRFRSISNRTGINLERMSGTVNINQPTLKGNVSQDFFIGNDKGSAKINIYDPILDAGKKVRIYFPAKEQGGTNIQNKADIKVFVNGVDKTSTMIQWL